MRNSATGNPVRWSETNAGKSYRERVSRGICVYCPNPADAPHVRCAGCREITSDYSAGRREMRKELGLCGDCGKAPLIEGRANCTDCRKRDREQRIERLRLGKCASCSRKTVPGKTHCRSCADRCSKAAIARKNERRRNNLCLSCGKPRGEKYLNCLPCRRKRARRHNERKPEGRESSSEG